ncbi:tigger transposable element-derived protein 3-like [Plakobranchus ocellatus]|uniref:Tigger transposable element-derived protein 3-like n=1 Tax=Plakobranchus ocellatus TaxID=259542 RepID=A0AAV4B077_9GAST|nr:tigger transposable element-derived protein 3-like [Plakobranchus ocellatus]
MDTLESTEVDPAQTASNSPLSSNSTYEDREKNLQCLSIPESLPQVHKIACDQEDESRCTTSDRKEMLESPKMVSVIENTTASETPAMAICVADGEFDCDNMQTSMNNETYSVDSQENLSQNADLMNNHRKAINVMSVTDSSSLASESAQASNSSRNEMSSSGIRCDADKPKFKGPESDTPNLTSPLQEKESAHTLPEDADDYQSNTETPSNHSDILNAQDGLEYDVSTNSVKEIGSHRDLCDSSRSNPVIKAEPATSSTTCRGVGKIGNKQTSSDKEVDKKKLAVLQMLNIPMENSATVTDEELKILTKYVFMNPNISEKIGEKTKASSKKEKAVTGTKVKRKCSPRNQSIEPAVKTERKRPTRFSSKKAVERIIQQDREEESSDEELETNLKLSLENKMRVLKLKKEGLTNVKIARKLGLTDSRVWRILQKEKELIAEAKHGKRKKKHRRTKKKAEKLRKRRTNQSDNEYESNAEEMVNVKSELDENEEDISSEDAELKTRGFKTRKDLTLEDRRKVIETLEASKTKVKDLARRFGVSTSSISRIKKNKEVMKLKLATGDLCGSLRRWRDCKDPELDKVLTKWYRAFEAKYSTGDNGGTVSVTNTLLREKAHDLALIMGTHYFASDNWIHRWKNRHNIKSRMNLISDRDIFQTMDAAIDISLILDALGKQQYKMDEVKREALRQQKAKPEEFLICEHCGVLISSRRKRLDHQPGCPGALSRKDLTLHEKANVVKQLEEPGVTMVSLAKKYGVSTSAISRIHKSRVEILARVAEGGKSLARRKRDRPSKEPEVERLLCDWYREQRDMGMHATGSAIRDKARDIARILGKDFWPSESWVFRWRHRHNMTGNPSELYDDDEEEEEDSVGQEGGILDPATGEIREAEAPALASATFDGDNSTGTGHATVVQPKLKRPRPPKLIMCEKCGCVSSRKKNSRPGRIRHAKGCPDIRQRNEMTYEDRAKMVHALEEPGATLSSVARQFGVSVSSMSRIRQRKNEILSFTGSKGESKRIRSCKEPEIAEMLYNYYMEKKAEGIHINGPKLKERASMLAQEMGREFKVSSGWLGRWRHRYNVFTSPKPPVEKIRDKDTLQASKTRRKPQRKSKSSLDGVRATKTDQTTSQVLSSDYGGDGTNLGTGVPIEESLESISAPMPPSAPPLQPPMFLHRGFQSTWDLVSQQQQQQQHQQQAVGSWVKDLTPGGVAISMGDHESVSYTYADTPASVLSKPIFHHHPHHAHHNMFENFPPAAVGYHVALPPGLDSTGNLVSRDFLKEDGDDSVAAMVKNNNSAVPSGQQSHGLPLINAGHLPHPHSILTQHQHTTLPPPQAPTSSSSSHHHLHHHHQLHQHHHSRQLLPSHLHHHSSQQQQPQSTSQHQAVHLHQNPVPSASSTPTPEEDPDQQHHLMNALKVMSTFAARKSLGDQVQSALRTIEMSMKGSSRKHSSTRANYTNI